MEALNASPVRQRAASSGVAVSLGLATVSVDFVPTAVPNKDKATEFHSLCDKCDQPTRLRQMLSCPAGHVFAGRGEVTVHGKELPDGTLVRVTAEEVAAVRANQDTDSSDGSDDKAKAMSLVPVRQADLMAHTLPAPGPCYRIRPAKKTPANGYALLHLLVTQALRTGKALVGRFAVREVVSLYWLTLRHNQIVAMPLVWPSDIAPFDQITEVDLPENVRSMAGELVERLTVEFDPADYRNDARDRAAKLVAAKTADSGSQATVTPISSKTKGEVDLEQLLSDMLAS